MRGVTIYYRGRLADTGQIRTISDELTAIAERMSWKWNSLDEDWETPATATISFERVNESTSHRFGATFR